MEKIPRKKFIIWNTFLTQIISLSKNNCFCVSKVTGDTRKFVGNFDRQNIYDKILDHCNLLMLLVLKRTLSVFVSRLSTVGRLGKKFLKE